MFAGRVPQSNTRVRPRVVLNGQFPFTDKLEIGDKGQIKVVMDVEGIRLEPDPDGNDRRHIRLLIKEAEEINLTDIRAS